MTTTDQSPAARDAILDSAERLFAQQGFASTTIKQIADQQDETGANDL